MEPQVFSPSQTELWSRCPVLWDVVRNKGWQGQTLGKGDISRVAGSAFAKGMEVYNRYVMAHGWNVTIAGDAVTEALAAKNTHLASLTAAGFDCSIFAEAMDLDSTLCQAITGAIVGDPTPKEWRVVAVEEPRPEFGNARCDVVYEMPGGERVVRDYKYTLAVDKKYVADRLNGYTSADQAYHYCWMEGCKTFIASLYVGSKPLLYEQPVTLDVGAWLASQRPKWVMMSGMKQGDVPVWRSSQHKDQYGVCALHDYCLTYGQDEKALPVMGFVQVEKKETPDAVC